MELDFNRVWLPYIYLYGCGAIIFTASLIAVIKAGGMNLKVKNHRVWLFISALGFFWYMFMHGFLTIVAIH